MLLIQTALAIWLFSWTGKLVISLFYLFSSSATLEYADQFFEQFFCLKCMGRQMYFYHLEWLYVYDRNKSGYLQSFAQIKKTLAIHLKECR